MLGGNSSGHHESVRGCLLMVPCVVLISPDKYQAFIDSKLKILVIELPACFAGIRANSETGCEHYLSDCHTPHGIMR